MLWTFNTLDSIYSSPALGADGTLYLTSFDSVLYAIDSITGIKKWSYRTDGRIKSS